MGLVETAVAEAAMRVNTVIIYNNYILTIIIIIEMGRVDEQDPREVRVRDFKFGSC